jgi:hypothetical protein
MRNVFPAKIKQVEQGIERIRPRPCRATFYIGKGLPGYAYAGCYCGLRSTWLIAKCPLSTGLEKCAEIVAQPGGTARQQHPAWAGT